MVQWDLNYVVKTEPGFCEKQFDSINEALKFIEENSDNLSYYTLWEVDVKIIKTSEDKK